MLRTVLRLTQISDSLGKFEVHFKLLHLLFSRTISNNKRKLDCQINEITQMKLKLKQQKTFNHVNPTNSFRNFKCFIENNRLLIKTQVKQAKVSTY